MKLTDLDQRFVDRLTNWGRFYRDQRRPGQSATYRVCQQLALAAGQNMHEGFREVSPAPEVDEDDARIMEHHWCMCAYRVSVQDRAMIKAHWVEGADPRAVCRVLKIRYLSWECRLCEAVESFRRAVELLERVV